MTPEQVAQIIEMLAEKLGPLGEHVWTIYVRQVYVDVVGGVLWIIALLIGAVAFQRLAIRARGMSSSVDREFMGAGAYIGIAVCILLAFCALTFGVLKILNPEYHAIQMLLGR